MEYLQRPMYVIKERYKGLIITRTVPGVGTITLDTTRVKESDLWKYLDIFGDIIDDIKVTKLDTCEDKQAVDFKVKKRGRSKKNNA